MAKKSSAFPKELHVTREDEGTDDEYLAIQPNDDDIADGALVAVYALVGTKTKRVTHRLD
jgi:hypothetical protein